MAYTFNYNHLDFTLSLFCWAWSHYLEGVAMIPQLWTMARLHREGRPNSTSIWIGVNMVALARVFQLLSWAYLYYDAEILDHLQVLASSFYLLSYAVFLIIILLQHMIRKKSDDKDNDKKVSVEDDKPKAKSE